MVISAGFVLVQMVLAKNGNGGFQIKDSYIEIQETDYPQNIALVKKENGKEEIAGQVKIVDQYLISDLPENEFLEEYPDLESGFQDLTLSLEADEPLFNKENFYHPLSLLDKAELKIKSLFGIKTQILPEYRITKEIDKSQSVQTKLDLSKVSLATHYKETEAGPLQVKQSLTLTNNSGQDLNLALLLKNQIEADKIYWNGEEYSLTENARKFINPDRISFGKAFYDFSDVPDEFEPELWVERTPHQKSGGGLILSLNVSISAGETKTIDPTYGVDTERGGYVKIEPSGTCERKGMVQVRLSMYLYPGDYGYHIPHVNPFHNHFIYVEPTMSDEEIMDIAEIFLKEAYDKWSANKTLDLKNPAVAWPATVNSARLEAVEVKVQHLKTTPLMRQNTLGK